MGKPHLRVCPWNPMFEIIARLHEFLKFFEEFIVAYVSMTCGSSGA
jgi:hypothetical protein